MTTARGRIRSGKRLHALLLVLALFTGPLSANPPQASLRITVQVYNSASVAPQILTAAEGEASRIFREAGVAASWLNCRASISEATAAPICEQPCPPTRFALRIVSDVPPGFGDTLLGLALIETGIYATVFYQRVDEFANERIATHSQILGHAMAHELGHLLLGSAPHARFGIMRGRWRAEDLRSMAMGGLLFRPEESAIIRNAAMRRMCCQESLAKYASTHERKSARN
jgi:hypothetical protein